METRVIGAAEHLAEVIRTAQSARTHGFEGRSEIIARV